MNASERLSIYRDLLLRWSATINLIGPEARANLDEHLAEALEAARILAPEGDVIDVGSGGGLPAIPMAIECRSARFHLVEADKRKWAFLKQAIRECALNSIAHGGRLADVIDRIDPAIEFSLVTSRAVGHPETWVPLLVPRLARDGRVALFQGDERVPNIDGLELQGVEKLSRGESNFLIILKRSS